MATTSGTPVWDKRSNTQVGVTGSVPNAIYKNGYIVGYFNPTNNYLKPASTTLPIPSSQPGSTPFISRTAVSGTEDVRGLPYGTTTQNLAATAPNQRPLANTPIASSSVGAFDVQGYVNQQVQDYLAAQKPKPPTTPEEIDRWVYDHYGYMAAYLNHPEIGDILREAARGEVTSEAQLFGMLSKTNWWKTTSEVARKWDYLVNTDPAEAQRLRDSKIAEVTNAAASLGIGMGGDMAGFVEQSLRAGWSTDQVTDYLLQRVQSQTSYTEGTLGALQNQVRETAARYLIDISDQTSSNYARRIASGELTIEGATSVFAQQARARFPWMAENIDKGITPADYFLPMRDQLARNLEITPDDIDPIDPKWMDVMEATDARTGEKRGATQYEILRRVRGMNDYYRTDGAKELYANLGMGLGQRLGAV